MNSSIGRQWWGAKGECVGSDSGMHAVGGMGEMCSGSKGGA
jgi:hypothetical protein